MAASMQGVIQKLREQEKELERLHKIEKERAEQTERLSEEVTRNMPAGLLVVNATGIISFRIRRRSKCWEFVVWDSGVQRSTGRGLRHDEAGGGMPRDGKDLPARRSRAPSAAGDTRHLGVTISPIRRGTESISGAICLLTDLTELAALQQRMQLKENLAALGELSAGIAQNSRMHWRQFPDMRS